MQEDQALLYELVAIASVPADGKLVVYDNRISLDAYNNRNWLQPITRRLNAQSVQLTLEALYRLYNVSLSEYYDKISTNAHLVQLTKADDDKVVSPTDMSMVKSKHMAKDLDFFVAKLRSSIDGLVTLKTTYNDELGFEILIQQAKCQLATFDSFNASVQKGARAKFDQYDKQ